MGLPVSSAIYFKGPNSCSASLLVSLFKTAISNFDIESVTASSLIEIASLSSTEVFNSFCRALLALDEEVVINCPDSLSIYCTCAGFERAILKSLTEVISCFFSSLNSDLFSSNL